MATTTNYSWTTPDDTALVKDGAAAIRSLGTAIDTTVFNNAGAAIAKTIVDAKGDLIVGTAADTVARLASSASNGDVLTVDTSTASGLKWAAAAGGGKVLQVVNATYGTVVTTASSTYQDTGLSASITPSSTTSKVLVLIHQNGCQKSGTSASIRMSLRLLRGATTIHTPGELFLFSNTANDLYGTTISASYLDSPSTTSSTTYKTQFRSDSAFGDVHVQANSQHTSSITLLEIGA